MPSISPLNLIDAILNAIEQSGSEGFLLTSLRTHPRKFMLSTQNGTISLWIYGWTLTPGGRPQLRNEYRIQMTSVISPLLLNPEGPTIIIGYEPNLKMFAGFDLGRHKIFTTGSPSVQIDISTLHEALQNGLAFYRKENNEIAIGIRPDQFMTYAFNSLDLHKYGKDKLTFSILSKASSLSEIQPIQMEQLSGKRKRVIETISRLSRSAHFRQQVLSAYQHRCAVTRIQLRLIEAAHILPVIAPDSIDNVKNGIALSPTYHRAFDNGLIYLDESFVMKINPAKETELIKERLDGGLEILKASLHKIHLPQDKRQWPDLKFIHKANNLRRISRI